MEVLKKTKRRLWLFLFLVLAILAVNCVRCQDLDKDYHYSRNNRKTLGDAELAAESAPNKNKSNANSSLPSTVTHVRTKRLNGNIQLTTLEVGTPGQEDAANMLNSNARTLHKIHEHPSLSSRRTTNAPASPDGPPESKANRAELMMDVFSRPHHTSAGTWLTKWTTEKQTDDGTLSPTGLIYAREYHETEEDVDHGTTEMDAVAAEKLTEITTQVSDGFEDGIDDGSITPADEFYSIFEDSDGDNNNNNRTEDSVMVTTDVSNYNQDITDINDKDDVEDSTLAPENAARTFSIITQDHVSGIQDLHLNTKRSQPDVELNSLFLMNEELIPADTSKNLKSLVFEQSDVGDNVVTTDISSDGEETSFETTTITPQVTNINNTNHVVVEDKMLVPKDEDTVPSAITENPLSAIQNINSNTEFPQPEVELHSRFLEDEELIPARTSQTGKAILLVRQKTEDPTSVTTDASRFDRETTFEGITIFPGTAEVSDKSIVENSTFIPEGETTVPRVIIELQISVEQKNYPNTENPQSDTELNSSYLENDGVIRANPADTQESILPQLSEIEDNILVTTDISTNEAETSFETTTILPQVTNVNNTNHTEGTTLVFVNEVTVPSVITENLLSAFQNINSNIEFPQPEVELIPMLLEIEELIPARTSRNQKPILLARHKTEDPISVATDASSFHEDTTFESITMLPQVANDSYKSFVENSTFVPLDRPTVSSRQLSTKQNISLETELSQPDARKNASFLENEELILASASNNQNLILFDLPGTEDNVSVTTDIPSNNADTTTAEIITIPPEVTNVNNKNPLEDTTVVSKDEVTLPSVITENPLSAIQNVNRNAEVSQPELELSSVLLRDGEVIAAYTSKNQKPILLVRYKIEDLIPVTTDVSSIDQDTIFEGGKMTPRITNIGDKSAVENSTFVPEDRATPSSVITKIQLSAIQNNIFNTELPQPNAKLNSSFLENEELIPVHTTDHHNLTIPSIFEIEDDISVTTYISSNNLDTAFQSTVFPPQVTNTDNKNIEEDTTLVPEGRDTIPSVITEDRSFAIQNAYLNTKLSQLDVKQNSSSLENEELIPASASKNQKPVVLKLSKLDDNVSVTREISTSETETTFEKTTFLPQATEINNHDSLEDTTLVPEDGTTVNTIMTANPLSAIQNIYSRTERPQQSDEMTSLFLEDEELIPAVTSRKLLPVTQNVAIQLGLSGIENIIPVTTDKLSSDQETSSEGTTVLPQAINLSDKSASTYFDHEELIESLPKDDITRKDYGSEAGNMFTEKEYSNDNADLNRSILLENEELISTGASHDDEKSNSLLTRSLTLQSGSSKVDQESSVTTDISSLDGGNPFDGITIQQVVRESALSTSEKEITNSEGNAILAEDPPTTSIPTEMINLQQDTDSNSLPFENEELVPISNMSDDKRTFQTTLLLDSSKLATSVLITTDVSSHGQGTIVDKITMTDLPYHEILNITTEEPVSEMEKILGYKEDLLNSLEADSSFLENEELLSASAPTIQKDPTLHSSQSGRMTKQLQTHSGTTISQHQETTSGLIKSAETTVRPGYVTEIFHVDSTSDAGINTEEKTFDAESTTEVAKEVSSLPDSHFSTHDTIEISTQTFRPLNNILESTTPYSALPNQAYTVQSAPTVEEVIKSTESTTYSFITGKLAKLHPNQLNDLVIEESRILEPTTTTESTEEGTVYSTSTEKVDLNHMDQTTIGSTADKNETIEENTGDLLTVDTTEVFEDFLESLHSEITDHDEVTGSPSKITTQTDVHVEETTDVDPEKDLSSIWRALHEYCDNLALTPETCVENLLSATTEDYFETTTESVEHTVNPAVEFDENYVLKALLSEEERILESIRQDLQRYHDFIPATLSTDATTQLIEGAGIPTEEVNTKNTLQKVLSERNNLVELITEDLQQYRDLIATRQLVKQYSRYSTTTIRNDWEDTQQPTEQFGTGSTINSVDHVTSKSVGSKNEDMEKTTTQFTEPPTIYNWISKAVDVSNNIGSEEGHSDLQNSASTAGDTEETTVEFSRSTINNIGETTESLKNDDWSEITTQLVEKSVGSSRESVAGKSLGGFLNSTTLTGKPTSTVDNWVEHPVTSTDKIEIVSLMGNLDTVSQHTSKDGVKATTQVVEYQTVSTVESSNEEHPTEKTSTVEAGDGDGLSTTEMNQIYSANTDIHPQESKSVTTPQGSSTSFGANRSVPDRGKDYPVVENYVSTQSLDIPEELKQSVTNSISSATPMSVTEFHSKTSSPVDLSKVSTEINILEWIDGKQVLRKPTREELERSRTLRMARNFHGEMFHDATTESSKESSTEIEDLSSFMTVDDIFMHTTTDDSTITHKSDEAYNNILSILIPLGVNRMLPKHGATEDPAGVNLETVSPSELDVTVKESDSTTELSSSTIRKNISISHKKDMTKPVKLEETGLDKEYERIQGNVAAPNEVDVVLSEPQSTTYHPTVTTQDDNSVSYETQMTTELKLAENDFTDELGTEEKSTLENSPSSGQPDVNLPGLEKQEHSPTTIFYVTKSTAEVDSSEAPSADNHGAIHNYEEELSVVSNDSYGTTSTWPENTTRLPGSTGLKETSTSSFGTTETATSVGSSEASSANEHGTTRTHRGAKSTIPDESDVTSTQSRATTDSASFTKQTDIFTTSFHKTAATTEWPSTDVHGSFPNYKQEKSEETKQKSVASTAPETSTNPTIYTRPKDNSTSVSDGNEVTTDLNILEFLPTNTYETTRMYKREKSIVSNLRNESDVISTGSDSATDLPASTRQKEIPTSIFDKTEITTEFNNLNFFTSNVHDTTQYYRQPNSPLPNSSEKSDGNSNESGNTTDLPISTRHVELSTFIFDRSETTTIPNFSAASSANEQESTQKYRQEKESLPHLANESYSTTNGPENVTYLPIYRGQETIPPPSLETKAGVNFPNEPDVAANGSDNISDVAISTISTKLVEIATSVVDVTEITREVDLLEVLSTNASVTTERSKEEEVTVRLEPNITSPVPEDITNSSVATEQGDVPRPILDKTDVTAEMNSSDTFSTNTHGTAQKYRQGKSAVPNFPHEQDTIEQEEIDTSTFDTFDTIPDFPFLETVPSKTYKEVEASEKLTDHSYDTQAGEIGDMEPQITGNVLGKPMNITVKINDKGSTFFVPPDAFLASSSASEGLNITWRSSSSQMNNSLFISPHEIDDGLVQLNLVRGNQLYVYRKNGNPSKLQSAGHKLDSGDEVKVITLEEGVQVFFSVTDFEEIKRIYAAERSLDEPPTEPVVSNHFLVKAHYAFVASSIGGVLVILLMYAMRQIWKCRNTNGFSPNADDPESAIVQLS